MMKEKPYLPVFLDLEGARVLVVGAGPVAARKIDALLAVGAAVTVAAPRLSAPVEERAAGGEITVVRGRYRETLLDGMELAFAAASATGFPGRRR